MHKINKDGTGVKYLIEIIASNSGSCPSRAPAKNILDEVKIIPLTLPMQEIATNKGIKCFTGPKTLSANVNATAGDSRISTGVKTAK